MSFGRKHETDAGWLATVPLFTGMDEADLARIAELSTTVEVPAGEILMDQGDPGLHCYVVVEGSAVVTANAEYVATSGPGAMIGEMALIDHRPRTATVIAERPMRLLRFDTSHFRTLLEEMPAASERVMAVLSSRLEQ